MLGILLFYYIGKSFYDLKEQSKTGRWLYVFYGIVSYVGAQFLSVAIIVIVMGIIDETMVDSIHERVWDLIGLPFGILACWGLYKYLKKRNERIISFDNSEVLDGSLIENKLN